MRHLTTRGEVNKVIQHNNLSYFNCVKGYYKALVFWMLQQIFLH